MQILWPGWNAAWLSSKSASVTWFLFQRAGTLSDLRRHEARHKPNTELLQAVEPAIPEPKKDLPEEDQVEHASEKSTEIFKCTECSKTYNTRNNLNRCMKRHIAIKQELYKCEVCEKVGFFLIILESTVYWLLPYYLRCPVLRKYIQDMWTPTNKKQINTHSSKMASSNVPNAIARSSQSTRSINVWESMWQDGLNCISAKLVTGSVWNSTLSFFNAAEHRFIPGLRNSTWP